MTKPDPKPPRKRHFALGTICLGIFVTLVLGLFAALQWMTLAEYFDTGELVLRGKRSPTTAHTLERDGGWFYFYMGLHLFVTTASTICTLIVGSTFYRFLRVITRRP